MVVFGVDEAGKGPVLGSMFAAAVVADPGDLPEDVDDSKTVPAERRAEMAAEIRDVAAVEVAEIPVGRIDAEDTDMNTLTVAAHAEALSAVARDGLTGTVDAGDTNAVRFARRADETDPVVGAASVVAKVERDAHVDRLAAEYGDVGSGYPSDPTTRAFLESYVGDHGRLPPCARESWQTSRDALAAASQASLGEFEPDGGRSVAERAPDGGRTGRRETTLDEFQ